MQKNLERKNLKILLGLGAVALTGLYLKLSKDDGAKIDGIEVNVDPDKALGNLNIPDGFKNMILRAGFSIGEKNDKQ